MPDQTISSYEVERLRALDTLRYWLWRVVTLVLVLTVVGMWGCPTYEVWQQGLKGQAELARAEQNRQIAIQVSRAKAEAAHYEAEADTIRAEGIAQSNHILGKSLTGDVGDRYLRYLWIEAIKTQEHVVYVPTEAGLPILEAGKRRP
jgi:regulator of protease activity HflC (stomatin/prohibitin superfamily)